MRSIPTTFGLLYFLEEIEFTEAALSADDDAAPLAPAFTQAIADWDGTFKTERAARREVIRAEAVVAVRNEQLDSLTMIFAKTARGLAPELLAKAFTMAPGRFIRTGLRKQAEHTVNVIAVQVGKLNPESPVFAFGAKLQTLAQSAVGALDHRAKVKGANATVGNDVDEWKEGINSLRLTTWTELLKIADAKGYPRTWVEAFFRRTNERGAETEGEPTPTPPTE
jgi:hypothetical protein